MLYVSDLHMMAVGESRNTSLQSIAVIDCPILLFIHITQRDNTKR